MSRTIGKARRRRLKLLREWGAFVRLRDFSSSAFSTNPCRVNDDALLDLKARRDATTHARRCPRCDFPLYRDERCCPLCGQERAFFQW